MEPGGPGIERSGERLGSSSIHPTKRIRETRTTSCRFGANERLSSRRGRFGRLAGERRCGNDSAIWWRSTPTEPTISRDDVLAIIDALVDIKAWTYDIHEYLFPDDDEEEENA